MGQAAVKDNVEEEISGWDDFLRMAQESFSQEEDEFTLVEELSKQGNLFTTGRYVDSESREVVLRYVDYLKAEVSDDPLTQQRNIDKFEEAKKLLKRQIEVLPELDHENLVKVHGCHVTDQGEYVIKREYVPGRSLEDAIEDGKRYSEQDVKEAIMQIGSGIKELHTKAIHRDLKPSNVIVKEDDTYVVTDFDVLSDGIDSTGGSTCVLEQYSSGFMPPEGLDGLAISQIDVYSLGVTAIRMLTGEDVSIGSEMNKRVGGLPSIGKNFRKYCKEPITDSFTGVLRKMVHPDFEKRYKNMDEVIAALNPPPIKVTYNPPKEKKQYSPVDAMLPTIGVIFAVAFGSVIALEKMEEATMEAARAEAVEREEKLESAKQEEKEDKKKTHMHGVNIGENGVTFLKEFIAEYGENPATLREYAQTLENTTDWETAVVLYREIGDKEAERKVLQQQYRRGSSYKYTIKNDFGYVPTLDDDFVLAKAQIDGCGNYRCTLNLVLDYAKRSKDKGKLLELARSLESKMRSVEISEHNRLNVIRTNTELFRLVGKGEEIGKAELEYFKRTGHLTGLSTTIPNDVISKKADEYVEKNDIDKAFKLYKAAGDKEGVRKILDESDKPYYRYRSIDAALFLGDLEKAQELTKKSFGSAHYSILQIKSALEKVKLEEKDEYFREAAKFRIRHGSHHEALNLYDYIGDEEGKKKALEAARKGNTH